MSGVPCHVSPVRCQVSNVKWQVSHVINFIYLFFGQSCGASWWRVCYQCGLTRLVSSVGAPLLSDCLEKGSKKKTIESVIMIVREGFRKKITESVIMIIPRRNRVKDARSIWSLISKIV